MVKSKKIIAIIEPDNDIRRKLMQRVVVSLQFAYTASDAGKLIRNTVHDYNLQTTYFVFADNFNFRDSPATTQRLFEMATAGIAVVVGIKKIPPSFEWFCDCLYQADIL